MKNNAKSKGCEDSHYHNEGSRRKNGKAGVSADGLLELTPARPTYPPRLGSGGPTLYARGNIDLLASRLVAVFSSVKATGSAILRSLEWARSQVNHGSVVISGFHSPLEQECLTLLLTRAVPVIACPAREIATYRLPDQFKIAIDAGRLLAICPFKDQRRITGATSSIRNSLVANLADEIVVLHASPDGAIARLAQEWAMKGKVVRYLV